MSHFTVMVALPGDIKPTGIQDALDEAMKPYDENLDVERYVEATRDQVIARERQHYIDVWAGPDGYIEKYAADPVKYRAESKNPKHVDHLEELIEENRLNTWTDEQWYQEGIKYEEPEDIGKDGEVYSERNKVGYWDWFVVGGRWGGALTLKEGLDPTDKDIVPLGTYVGWMGETERSQEERNVDCARLRDIAAESIKTTYAYVNLEGEWIGKGKMGWFGMSSGDEEQQAWDTKFYDWIKSLPSDTWLVMTDAHV